MKFYVLLAALLSVCAAFSQNWTGAVNSDWNNPSNWSSVPQNGDNITIALNNYTGAMAHPVIASNASFSPAEMLVEGGAILTVNANLTTTDRVEIFGEGTAVIVNSGILSIQGGAGNARIIFSDGAHFEMNGGLLNVGQRLLFELGASGSLNDGNIDVAETFALIDGNATASSSFTQNGGTLITEEFGFENEAGTFYPTYYLNNGELQINTALLVEGVSPGAGRGTLLGTSGVCNVNGTLGNLPGSTMNFTLRFHGDVDFNMMGTSIDQLAGDSIVVRNGAEMTVGAALNWQNEGVVTGQLATLKIDGSTSLFGSGIYQFPNLILSLTKTLNHIATVPVFVNGDFSLFGVYNQLQHSLEFNGDTEQLLLSVGPIALDNIVLNNSGDGVVFDHNLLVNQSVVWNDGFLKSAGSQLVFADNSVSMAPSENSYANCTVVKNGNESFVFPVGSDNGRYRPLEISAPVSTATNIEVTYHPIAYASLTPVETPLLSVSALEYWDVNQTGSADQVTAVVSWNDASQSGLVDCASISMARWSNGQWNFVPSTASGLCSGTGSGSLSTMSAIPLAPLTIGFTDDVYQQQVELCFGDSLIVGDNTHNVSGVYIDSLMGVNGEDSLVITALTVLPQINSTVNNNVISLESNEADASYQWLDCLNNYAEISGETSAVFYPFSNGSYAVRIEKNGCVDTSACYLIDELSLTEMPQNFAVYPNPVGSANEITVKASGVLEHVSILDAFGQTVAQYNFIDGQTLVILPVSQLPEGVYIILVKAQYSSGKLIKLVI